MITKTLTQVFLTIGLMNCNESNSDPKVPPCLKEMIEEIKNDDIWNPPAKIYRYEFEGQKVYYIPPRCCDIPGILLNESCETLCSPDGGFTGQGDGNCPDFFEERTNEVLIWEDDRD